MTGPGAALPGHCTSLQRVSPAPDTLCRLAVQSAPVPRTPPAARTSQCLPSSLSTAAPSSRRLSPHRAAPHPCLCCAGAATGTRQAESALRSQLVPESGVPRALLQLAGACSAPAQSYCRARGAAAPRHARDPYAPMSRYWCEQQVVYSRLESTAVSAPRAPRALRPRARTSSISKIQDVALASSCASAAPPGGANSGCVQDPNKPPAGAAPC
jgi:hypothetical protein